MISSASGTSFSGEGRVGDQRVYGRTIEGTQEILHKTGRLTQSERLVLIVLGGQMSKETLLQKLPSLAPSRIEHALERLQDYGLAYEILVAQTIPADLPPIPVSALRDFLAQDELDPVTVMATPEMLERTDRIKAINASIATVIADARADRPQDGDPTTDVPVPLSRIFPPPPNNDPTSEPLPSIARAEGASMQFKALRDKAEEQIRALEAELHAKRASGRLASGARPAKGARSRIGPKLLPASAAPFSWLVLVAVGVGVVVALAVRLFS